ncbi:hypothetical protein N9B90_01955, partial [bacterium]|nr:hypothetical protein [bacterium]
YFNDTWEYDCPTCATLEVFGNGCGALYPLTLRSNPPRMGATWHLTTTFGEWSPAYTFYFGTTSFSPGINLSTLGATGCFVYTSANLGAIGSGIGFGATFAMPIPYLASLQGYQMIVQTLVASSNNPAGFVTSNGLKAVIGY